MHKDQKKMGGGRGKFLQWMKYLKIRIVKLTVFSYYEPWRSNPFPTPYAYELIL